MPRPHAVYPPKLIRAVSRLYAKGLSQRDVAAKLGLPHQTVEKLMATHELAVRTRKAPADAHCGGCKHFVVVHRGSRGECLAPGCYCDAVTPTKARPCRTPPTRRRPRPTDKGSP